MAKHTERELEMCPECEEAKVKRGFRSRSALSAHRHKVHGIAPYKYQSRSARAGEQASQWRSVAERLREIADNEKDEAKAVKDAQGALEDLDTGELESLRDKMSSWRDNMSGTSLESTGKYETVSEAADTLDNIDVEGKSISEVDEIEDVAQELEDAADELECIEFPGMY